MSTFAYIAVRSDGQKVTGEFDAPSRSEAFRKLDRDKLQTVTLRLKGETPDSARAVAAVDRSSAPIILTRTQVVKFTNQLSDLLEAGFHLEPALRVMEDAQGLASIKTMVHELRQRVVEGTSFSSALRSTSSSFGELYCGLVAAGELSGSLPRILRRQANYLASMDELQKRVLSALGYPACLVFAAVTLMVIFVTVLVPQMTLLFSRTGKAMPLVTRILIAVSNFVVHDWWIALLVMVVTAVTFWRMITLPWGRQWWDSAKLRIPVIGSIIATRFYTQLAQTLATLIGGGVTLLNSLKLMQAATANVYFRGLLEQMTMRVADGKGLSQSMRISGQFPAILVEMVVMGEHTGDLAKALENVALQYDKELNARIQWLTALIQPVIIIVMAILVGSIAYAMITGIFQSISGLRSTG